MIREIRQAVSFTLVTLVLFGGGYHAAIWGIGRLAFPDQAEGSLVRRADGRVVGSRLIAQRFSRPEYFHPRPSAVDYNAASTGGSNYGPSNADYLALVRQRRDAVAADEGVPASRVPSEMVTASGAGLDPDVPKAGADVQTARVALARGVAVERVHDIVTAHVEPPALGFLGRARVNVLELNLALDAALGPPPATQPGTTATGGR